jgi:hypothetical protein
MLHLDKILKWRCNLDIEESRTKTLGKFRNVLLEKDGDQLD